MEIIKVENLHKSFGDNNVLRGIDLNIEQGDVVVIIGPSGSGKSTILRTLNLLEQPTSGKIYCNKSKGPGRFKKGICHS